MINWMKFRPVYFLLSGLALTISVYAILSWGFKPSIDFTGGSIVEYKFNSEQTAQVVQTVVQIAHKEHELKNSTKLANGDIELKFGPDFTQGDAQMLAVLLGSKMSDLPSLVRFENVGPVLSDEILKKTYVAVGIACLGILLWIALQFKNVKFGVFAIFALVHDLIILLGTFAILGRTQHVEVDILVVTAFLTTLSLSLYDTIVVYDRIRETMKKHSGSFYELSNKAVTETMVRSLNTSLTTAFVLIALFLFGGVTIKWFVLALLIGVISGTYSSPFVATPLLVTWHELKENFKKRKT